MKKSYIIIGIIVIIIIGILIFIVHERYGQELIKDAKTMENINEETDMILIRNVVIDKQAYESFPKEEKEIIDRYAEMQQAMIDKDIDKLDEMIVDGTTFTHMSGKTQTKNEFFGEIADGTLNYYKAVIHDSTVSINGDEATMNASVTLTAKVYGSSGEWTLPANAYFKKINNIWYSGRK